MKYTKKWLKCAFKRVIRTMAQSALAILGVYTYLHEFDWRVVVSASAFAGILSFLTSLAGLPEAEE